MKFHTLICFAQLFQDFKLIFKCFSAGAIGCDLVIGVSMMNMKLKKERDGSGMMDEVSHTQMPCTTFSKIYISLSSFSNASLLGPLDVIWS